MTIGTVLVVSKITSRATAAKFTTSGTQTDPGLWLPQVPMWIDTGSESSVSSLDTSNLEMEIIPRYKQKIKLVDQLS